MKRNPIFYVTMILIISVFSVLMLIFNGCATIPKQQSCPAENTVFQTPGGLAEMPKGFFDQGEGENWMHTDDIRAQERKQQGF